MINESLGHFSSLAVWVDSVMEMPFMIFASCASVPVRFTEKVKTPSSNS